MGWLSTPKAPKPDPAIGRAAEEQAAIGREMADLAREEFEFGKGLVAQYGPVYERLINADIEAAETAARRGDEQWADYEAIFRPVERRFAEEAMSWDSPAEIAKRQGAVGSTIQGQIDNVRAQSERALAAQNVDPASGRATAIDNNALALAKVGAMNKTATDAKMEGVSMRQAVANFGRNMPNTSIAQGAAALQGNQAAANTIGAQTAQGGVALQPATALYGGATGAMGSAANIHLGQYQGQLSGYGAQMTARGQALGSLGSLVGTGIGAYAALSDEDAKKNIEPVSDEESLEAVRETPVKEWDYQPGMGDGGHHVGAMAQDVNASMGEAVAPNGKQIDVISYMGRLHSAVRALDKKIKGMNEDEDDIDPSALRLEPLRI